MKKYFVIGGIALFFLIVMKAVFMQASSATSPSSLHFPSSALPWLAGALLAFLVILGALGKGGKAATSLVGGSVVFLIVYLGFYFIFGDQADVVASKLREDAVRFVTEDTKREAVPSAGTQPSVREGKARWDNVADGAELPVGVWSNTMSISGCKATFDSGYGIHYKVRHRFPHTKWTELIPGENVKGTEIEYMVLEAGRGMKSTPITLKCQQ